MLDIRKGDVFWCHLDKIRPCVVVSSNQNNFNNQNVIVVPVSATVRRTDLPTHSVLKFKLNNRQQMTMTEFFYTVNREELFNYICSLSESDMRAVEWSIKKVLGL